MKVDNPFAGRIICGHCGSTFERKVWNSTDERLRRVIWRCNKKYKVKGEKSCENKHIDDRVLYQAFINTFNAMIENKGYFIEKWKKGLKSENILARYKFRQFIGSLKNAEPIQSFDMDLFFSIIEKITVYEGQRIIVTLLDTMEIECEIE
ncbi:zinc ribbon domain-containing protein [Clostridium pasteurianum]|uniref:zinc ribbon domain-containing protein n=1 Tax=Clostridium pasteurianum TaxID=1501 RepID=UPI001FA726DF|nr:zinc ribbon domain-containing protein [Clostridium pasteurianum]